MSRSRILSSIAAASLSIAMLGACSAEALTERAASFGLEQALEGDQDIDFDFGNDGSGGFSISTEEGDFSLNFDEDNGGIVFNTDEGDGVISFDEDGIVFNTDEGDGVISFDEDGIVFNTDEGDGVISFDEDNGTIDFNTDEGDGSINFGENGDLTIQTEDGEFGAFSSIDPPTSWPRELPVPGTLVPGTQSFSVLDLGSTVITTGTFQHDPAEPYAAAVAASLTSTGWTQDISSTQDGAIFAQLSNGTLLAQIVTDGSGYSTVSVTQMN